MVSEERLDEATFKARLSAGGESLSAGFQGPFGFERLVVNHVAAGTRQSRLVAETIAVEIVECAHRDVLGRDDGMQLPDALGGSRSRRDIEQLRHRRAREVKLLPESEVACTSEAPPGSRSPPGVT